MLLTAFIQTLTYMHLFYVMGNMGVMRIMRWRPN